MRTSSPAAILVRSMRLRKAEAIAAEAALDGIYVIRSNLPENGFPAAAIVLAYKGLSHAERGFRDIKSGDLDVRPIHHRRAHRVRAHVSCYACWPTTSSGT